MAQRSTEQCSSGDAKVTMADQVFAVTDLLEAVLVQVPLRDLLSVRLLCKRWQVIMERGTPVKRAVFLEAETARDTLCFVRRIDNECTRRYGLVTQVEALGCTEFAFHPRFCHLSSRFALSRSRFFTLPASDVVRRMYIVEPPVASALVRIELISTAGTGVYVDREAPETFGTLREKIVNRKDEVRDAGVYHVLITWKDVA